MPLIVKKTINHKDLHSDMSLHYIRAQPMNTLAVNLSTAIFGSAIPIGNHTFQVSFHIVSSRTRSCSMVISLKVACASDSLCLLANIANHFRYNKLKLLTDKIMSVSLQTESCLAFECQSRWRRGVHAVVLKARHAYG